MGASHSLKQPTILFDGVCNLCDHFVSFLMKQDSQHLFYFSSLQGETARRQLLASDLSPESLVFSDHGTVYHRSTAVLRVMILLGGVYKFLAYIMLLFPLSIRDAVYRLIAKNRYTLFGKKDFCRLPTEDEKKYFYRFRRISNRKNGTKRPTNLYKEVYLFIFSF